MSILPVCMQAHHVHDLPTGASDRLELELKMSVSHRVGAGY